MNLRIDEVMNVCKVTDIADIDLMRLSEYNIVSSPYNGDETMLYTKTKNKCKIMQQRGFYGT